MKKLSLIFLSVVTIVTCGLRVSADSWALPTPKQYYSENKRYYIEIIPRVLESDLKFFEDKVAKKEPAGSKPGVKDNYCKGVFYRQVEGGKFEKVWESRLSNDVAPTHAIVSDGGEYVVTFDNWHSVGFGDNVVVIYEPGGKMVRKMGLPDFVAPDANLPRSVSSIWWGGKHYIDEKNLRLVLKILSKWSMDPDDKPEYKDVLVDLRTGELIKAPVVAD